jgi:DnaJ-class molecular chaperone
MNNLQENYKLLQVSENSSIDQIKKSYRRLCLKHHPDKNNNTDSEQFLKIKKAYEDVVKAKEANINFFIMFFYFINTFGKDQNVTINLMIRIDDIYNNAIKKVSYKRVENTLEKTQQLLYLELSGWKEQYVLEGYGDYNIILKQYGNLIINVEITNENYQHLQLNKIINLYDVYTEVEINLYEYYYGVNRTITYFNNELLHLQFCPFLDGETQMILNKGLTSEDEERANLYVFYKVNLNACQSITAANEMTIKNIFDK